MIIRSPITCIVSILITACLSSDVLEVVYCICIISSSIILPMRDLNPYVSSTVGSISVSMINQYCPYQALLTSSC